MQRSRWSAQISSHASEWLQNIYWLMHLSRHYYPVLWRCPTWNLWILSYNPDSSKWLDYYYTWVPKSSRYCLCCHSTSAPSEDQLNKVLYIYHYLIRMRNYSLDYNGHSKLRIMACIDSNWEFDPILCCSQTDYFFKIVDGFFSWSSHTQKSVTLSSTKAEYMALLDCSCQAIWIWTLLHELRYKK